MLSVFCTSTVPMSTLERVKVQEVRTQIFRINHLKQMSHILIVLFSRYAHVVGKEGSWRGSHNCFVFEKRRGFVAGSRALATTLKTIYFS